MTTYSNIISTAPFFKNLASDDQGYLKAALQEEMSHFLLEESLTRKPAGFTTFYYPKKMFADAQTTLNTLVTLEDAFIAAYLVGVREFSTRGPARDRGAHHGHRVRPPHARARRRARAWPTPTAGPIEAVTGIQKQAESVDPPNNNGYERTLGPEEHRPGRRSAAAVRGTEGGRKSRLRRDQALQVPAVHADAARARWARSTRSRAEPAPRCPGARAPAAAGCRVADEQAGGRRAPAGTIGRA